VRFNGAGEAEPGTAEDFETSARRARFVAAWIRRRARACCWRSIGAFEDARDSLCDPSTISISIFRNRQRALLDYERDLGGPTSRTDYVRFAAGAAFHQRATAADGTSRRRTSPSIAARASPRRSICSKC
jgi:magnesium transporter/zinc transporter